MDDASSGHTPGQQRVRRFDHALSEIPWIETKPGEAWTKVLWVGQELAAGPSC